VESAEMAALQRLPHSSSADRSFKDLKPFLDAAIHLFLFRLSRLLALFHFCFASADLFSQFDCRFPRLSSSAYCRWHSSEQANTDLNSNRLLYRSTFFPQLQHDSSTFS